MQLDLKTNHGCSGSVTVRTCKSAETCSFGQNAPGDIGEIPAERSKAAVELSCKRDSYVEFMQSLGAFSALMAAFADDLQKSSPLVNTNRGFAIHNS